MMPYLTEISLLVITLIVFTFVIKWHNSPHNTFDLTDAIIGEDGKFSLFRAGQAVALIVSTWAFVVLVQRNALTEYYFYGYMGIWSGINLAKNLLKKESDASQT